MFKRAFNLFTLIILYLLISLNIAFGEVIKKIEISGNERIPDETIKMFGDISLNKNITSSDINKIIKDLYNTNFFEFLILKLLA